MAKRRVSPRKLSLSIALTVLAAFGLVLGVMFVNGMFGSFDIRNQAAGNKDASVKCEKGFYSAFDSSDVLSQSEWDYSRQGNDNSIEGGQLVQRGSPAGAWFTGRQKQNGDLYAVASVTEIDFASSPNQTGTAVLQFWNDGENFINWTLSRREGKTYVGYSVEKNGTAVKREQEIGSELPVTLIIKRQGSEAEFTYQQNGRASVFGRVSDVYTGEVAVGLVSQVWGEENLPLTVKFGEFFLSCPNKFISCRTSVKEGFNRLNDDLWSRGSGNSVTRSSLRQLAKSPSEGVWITGRSHVQGDFQLDTTFRALTKTASDPQSVWTVLDAKYDDNNFAHLAWIKNDGRSYLRFYGNKDGVAQPEVIVDVPQQNVRVRMVRQGSDITAWYRATSKSELTKIGTITVSEQPMGYAFTTSTSGPRAAALIDDFQLSCPAVQ